MVIISLFQTLKIGIQSRIQDAWEPPQETGSLILENCHHVELFSRLVNHMKDLKNITIRHSHTVVIHPRLYEARGALPDSGVLDNIEFTNIHRLVVKRYSFKDVQVKEKVYMGEVSMASVVSMLVASVVGPAAQGVVATCVDSDQPQLQRCVAVYRFPQ